MNSKPNSKLVCPICVSVSAASMNSFNDTSHSPPGIISDHWHYRTPFLSNDLCTGSYEQIQQRSISCLLLGALWPSNQRQHHGEAPRGPRDVGTIHQAPSDATVGECPDTRTTWTTDQSDSDPSTPRGAEYQGLPGLATCRW